ncbi:MAG: hypothetical protein JRI59_10485 [Deltaproteobacteria bacterium]|nr:hypothetical protein [Deltaproteobacteria bacterium]
MTVKWAIHDEAAGRRSRSALVAMAAFWFASFKFLLSGATLIIWGHTIEFGEVDAVLLGAFLTPCFALYFGRRATDAYTRARQAEHGGGDGQAGAVSEARG